MSIFPLRFAARACTVLVALAVAGLVAVAARAQPVTTTLSLEDCVNRALEANFSLAIQRYTPGEARDLLTEAKSSFLPTLTASATRNVQQTASAELPGTRADTSGATFGVTELLPTGTVFGITTNLNRSALSPVVATLDPAYTAGVTLTLQQPLFQGAGTLVTTAARRHAEVGVAIADRELFGLALQVVNDTESAYFAWAGARADLAVVQSSLALAEKLQREAEVRQKTGIATKLDVLEAQVAVASAQDNVLQSQAAVHNAEDALCGEIGQFQFYSDFLPVRTEEPVAAAEPDVDATFAAAKARSPEYLNQVENVKLAKLDVAVSANGLKPNIALGLTVGLDGTGGSGDSAYDRTVGRQQSLWQLGLTWTYPWDRTAEKARYHSANSAQRQAELTVRQLEQNLLIQVRQAVRDVEVGRQGLVLAAASVDLSEKQYDLERARFAQGLSTSRLVLQAQDDLESARKNQVRAKLSFQLALAAVRKLEASSLEHYGIDSASLAVRRGNPGAPRRLGPAP